MGSRALPVFEIFRVGGIKGGASELIAKLGAGETSYDEVAPTPGAPVQYQVIARHADQTTDASPWVSYAPPPLTAPVMRQFSFFEPSFEAPPVTWTETAGIRYALVKTRQPGVPSYPPVTVYLSSVASPGGIKTVDKDMTGLPLGDLHDVMYFQLSADNGRGEVATGNWTQYDPLGQNHLGVGYPAGSYWEVPRPDGSRDVQGCVSWIAAGKHRSYGLSVLHGSGTQWSALQRFTTTGQSPIAVGVVSPTEVVAPVKVRIHTRYATVYDMQHFTEVLLLPVPQPVANCP